MSFYPVRLSCVVTLLLLPLLEPAPAWAQAWIPAKNTGSVSIYYKGYHVKNHTDVDGIKTRPGVVDTHILQVDAEYAPTRRWALNLSVPYVASKYTGLFPHVDEHHNLDDGTFHSGVQDFRFGMRYRLLNHYSSFAITPFVEGVVPSHSYTHFAHAAIGRNLHELLVGANIGWQGESVLPNASVQARISYGFVEKVLGRSHDRTNIESQFSYRVTPRLGVHALASFAKHHGGLDWDSTKGPPPTQWTAEELLHHDQLTRSDMFDIGGGVSFRINDSARAFATFIHTQWSRTGHPWNTGVTAGVSFPFRTRKPAVFQPESRLEALAPIPDRR